MGFLPWKKKNSKAIDSYDNEQAVIPVADTNLPALSNEDRIFEDQLIQREFERDLCSQKFNAQIEIAHQALGTVNKLVDVWQYSKQVEQNIAQIRAATDIELAKISSKFQLQQMALVGIFGERQQGLSAHFDILNNAVESNDREMIIRSLQGISTIVTSDPLESFEKLARAWEDTSKPLELDF